MKITNTNYFSPEANKEYMSVSQYKDFKKCEAMSMAKISGEFTQKKTKALLIGSYVDAYFEGTFEEFKNSNPEIFKKDNTLKADYIKTYEIIQRIEKDKLFMTYMSGEKQKIFTAEMYGTKWKIKIDSLLSDKIVDLKIMRSMDRIMGKSFIEHWGYDIQMAIYAEVESRRRGENIKALETFLAVATKEDETNLEIIHIPDYRRAECLEQVKKDMPHILEVKTGKVEPERCGVCDHCKKTKVLKEPIDFELVGFSASECNAMMGVI